MIDDLVDPEGHVVGKIYRFEILHEAVLFASVSDSWRQALATQVF